MNIIKTLFFLIIFLAVAFFIQSKVQPEAQQKILNFLSESIAPNIPFYSFFMDNIATGNIVGVITFIAFANIPILPNPPSEIYILFAASKGTNPILLVLTVSAITLITSSVTYSIGYIFGPKIVEKITKKEFKYSKIMNSLSAPITFLTHLLPLPIPGIFPFIFGAYKSNYKNFSIAVALGTLIRFSAVMFLYAQYGDVVSQSLDLLKSFF